MVFYKNVIIQVIIHSYTYITTYNIYVIYIYIICIYIYIYVYNKKIVILCSCYNKKPNRYFKNKIRKAKLVKNISTTFKSKTVFGD